jgi:PBP1b-binding outer membrane lipoprotein LpoB
VIELQINDTLMLADSEFVDMKEKELVKAKITFKFRDMLITFISIKFNDKYIKLIINNYHILLNVFNLSRSDNREIHLIQENQMKNIQSVTIIKNATLKRARDKIRLNVSSKEQYVTQRLRETYIVIVC